VRLAAIDEATGLRLLGDWDWCWSDAIAEFVDEVDWSLVEAHDNLPDGSDELRLLAAWVQEIIDVKRPRRNGPITLAWFGETAPPTTVEGLTTSTTGSAATGTTTAGSYIDYGRLPLNLALGVSEMGQAYVRGWVVAADGETVTVEVFDVLAGVAPEGVEAGRIVTVPTYDPEFNLNAAETLAEAVTLFGERLPALVFMGPDGQVDFVTVLDGSLIRFSRDTTSEPRVLHFTSNNLAIAVDGDHIEMGVVPPVDPGRFTYCQDLRPTVRRYEPVTGDEVADVLAFGMSMIPPEPSPGQVSRREADRLAETTRFIDEVTGRSTYGWVTDVVDQALRGVPHEDLVVHPTVQVSVRHGGYGEAAYGLTLVFGEAGTGRLLGWVGTHEKVRTDTITIMSPPTGADINIYLLDSVAGVDLCLEDAGDPYMVIPYDQFAGTRRAHIDLVKMTVEDWDGP